MIFPQLNIACLVLMVQLFSALASALSLTSSIHAVTPWKTATTRTLGAGDDTISSVHRLSCNGRTLSVSVRHHGKLHQNKKNGGRTYTRYIDERFEVPDGIDISRLMVSSMLVNMANPKDDVLYAMIEAMDHGVNLGLPTEGKDLMDFFNLPFGDFLGVVPGVDLPALWSRFTGRLRNADGPVWYSRLALGDVDVASGGKVWDGSCTRSSMSHNAVYEVDWKVIKN